MGPEREQAGAQGTRERILDAAEGLFARQGFAATSLRSITAEAGANIAAIHYHFGSKEELVRALFARRIEPVNRERLSRLDALEAGAAAGPLDLDRLIEIFVAPGLRLAKERPREGRVIMCLLGRTYSEPTEDYKRIFFEQFEEIKARFLPAFQRALPDLPEEDLYWRLHFLIGAMAQTMAEPERLRVISDGRCDPGDVDGTVRRLVEFLAAGLRAPVGAPAGREVT